MFLAIAHVLSNNASNKMNVLWELRAVTTRRVFWCLVEPGGSIMFRVQGEGELYVNNVTNRSAFLPETAKRSFIAIGRRLPSGVIERFYIYVHNIASLSAESQYLRLQVWRVADLSLQRNFRLIWSQRVYVTTTAALYSVRALVLTLYILQSGPKSNLLRKHLARIKSC